VDSLRLIEEFNELKKDGNAYLIFVDADVELRYKRSKERKRITDNISLEKFKEIEDKERYGKKTLMKMEDCFTAADFKILNNNGVKELHKEIDVILKKIS